MCEIWLCSLQTIWWWNKWNSAISLHELCTLPEVHMHQCLLKQHSVQLTTTFDDFPPLTYAFDTGTLSQNMASRSWTYAMWSARSCQMPPWTRKIIYHVYQLILAPLLFHSSSLGYHHIITFFWYCDWGIILSVSFAQKSCCHLVMNIGRQPWYIIHNTLWCHIVHRSTWMYASRLTANIITPRCKLPKLYSP